MKPIRILLADDHALVRAGIRSLLQSIAGVEVVAEAGDGREAIRLCEHHHPDIVLMDIAMPELNGLDATACLALRSPTTQVIILSMSDNDEYVRQAFRVGARGYLLKNVEPGELERAIRSVSQGEIHVSPAAAKHFVGAHRGEPDAAGRVSVRLTPRQREILQLVAEGNSTKQIAKKLGISVKTVEAHRGSLMNTLDVHNIAGLVRFAIRDGLIDVSKPDLAHRALWP